MTRDPLLEGLHQALDMVGPDREAAVVLAEMIDRRAAAVHPPGREDVRQAEIDGLSYAVDVGDRFGRALYYGSRQEHAELHALLALCPEGGEVWDVGANFGLYASAAAKKIGAAGRVQAFEPNRRALILLERNIRLGADAAPVAINAMALAGFDGEATFFEAEESAFSGLSDTGRSRGTSHTVTVRRLDTIWRELGARPIDVLKIDVEGHEGDVLAGAGDALAASPAVVLQFEVSAKNLDADRRARLLAALGGLEAGGMRIWRGVHDGAPSALAVADPAFLERAEGNLHMVRADSGREAALLAAASRPAPAALDGDANLAATLAHSALRYAEEIRRARGLAELAERQEAAAMELRERIDAKDRAYAEIVVELRGRLDANDQAYTRIIGQRDDAIAQRETVIGRLTGALASRIEDSTGLSARRRGMPGAPPVGGLRGPLVVTFDGALDAAAARALAAEAAGGAPHVPYALGEGAYAAIQGDENPDIGVAHAIDEGFPAAALGAACLGELALLLDPANPASASAVAQGIERWRRLAAAGRRVGGVRLGVEHGGALLLSAQALRRAAPDDAPAGRGDWRSEAERRLTSAGLPLVDLAGQADGDFISPISVRPPSLPADPRLLARAGQIAVVIRASTPRPPLGWAASAAVTAAGRHHGGPVVVVDARADRSTPLNPPPRLGVFSAPYADPLDRHARALAAALAAVLAKPAGDGGVSHVLVLGAEGFVEPEAVRAALGLWRAAADKGVWVGAAAFPHQARDAAAPEALEEFYGAPVARDGLFSVAALREVGLPGPEEARGGGFEVALALRLRDAGFAVLDGGGAAPFIRRGAPPSPNEDRDFLELSRRLTMNANDPRLHPPAE